MLLLTHQSLQYAFIVVAQRPQFCILTLAIQYQIWNDGRGGGVVLLHKHNGRDRTAPREGAENAGRWSSILK